MGLFDDDFMRQFWERVNRRRSEGSWHRTAEQMWEAQGRENRKEPKFYGADFGSGNDYNAGYQTYQEYGANAGKQQAALKQVHDFITARYGQAGWFKFLSMMNQRHGRHDRAEQDERFSQANHNPWAAKFAGWNESFNGKWYWSNGHNGGYQVLISGIKPTVTLSKHMGITGLYDEPEVEQKWRNIGMTDFADLDLNPSTKEYW